ncbi:hypothetical protein [Neobacillus ginsengisoli]|uniref:Uncharacterized protein n=1 Tax=Neobacillus ginsengisoli TaxID=904295 RepID=A0ABT9XWZ3_9BACI|nr:hypothetical protein [Neobacillus ginsengisoli]MDQ0200092.1 hypothetical protein [Neobacillus ginsengisoli]
MFNEYGVLQWIKFRQEEIERNARDAWKFYTVTDDENKPLNSQAKTQPQIKPCCGCA